LVGFTGEEIYLLVTSLFGMMINAAGCFFVVRRRTEGIKAYVYAFWFFLVLYTGYALYLIIDAALAHNALVSACVTTSEQYFSENINITTQGYEEFLKSSSGSTYPSVDALQGECEHLYASVIGAVGSGLGIVFLTLLYFAFMLPRFRNEYLKEQVMQQQPTTPLHPPPVYQPPIVGDVLPQYQAEKEVAMQDVKI